jgi:hypothetical protein
MLARVLRSKGLGVETPNRRARTRVKSTSIATVTWSANERRNGGPLDELSASMAAARDARAAAYLFRAAYPLFCPAYSY